MEFLAEVFIVLVQIICEVLLQLVNYLLAEVGWRSLAGILRRCEPPHRGLLVTGHIILGAALGGVSLVFFPKHFAVGAALRLGILALAPIASALLILPVLPLLRRLVVQVNIRQRFWHAYAFSLAFALIRFAYARVG